MEWEDYVSIIGTTIPAWDVLRRKHGEHKLPANREEFSDKFWAELERRVAAGHLVALEGVEAALASVRTLGLRLGLASSSRRSYVEAVLRGLGVLEAFEAIVCREDVVVGKPDPAPFLEAARRLGVDPASCLVVEDSPAGLAAARAAGMRAIAIKTIYTKEEDLRGAESVLPSLLFFDLSGLIRASRSV
jgi:HAD superfamily hydrolase (TIGR01509 family)